KYLRFGFDFRQNKVIDGNTVLAYRINTGVAYAYGENNTVPYEKFFFAGGSSSVRAWRPRRLGPGSFKPNLSADAEANGLFDYSLEKPADILIEASIELRQRSEEHTSELQSRENLVCRLLLEKKKKHKKIRVRNKTHM